MSRPLTVPVAGVCSNCGVAVRPDQPHSYVEAVAWERIGSRGRSRRVTERSPTGRVRCPACPPGMRGEQETLI